MAVAGLGEGGGSAGQDRSGCCFGVDGVGFAAASPVGLVRLIDLDDIDAGPSKMTSERGAIGMGSLHSGLPYPALGEGPVQ
nr:hypothetical protein [Amycolatopsis sp. Hca4]